MGGDWFDRLVAGIKYPGLAAFGYFIYRSLVFACTFLAGRHDARQDRLDALDVRLAKSVGQRLDHLEQQQEQDAARIQMLEEWVAALSTELRAIDPENPRLKELSEALRLGIPIAPPDPGLHDLLHRASDAVERSQRK